MDTTQPGLPFEIWIALIDLLTLEAWRVYACALGPQLWDEWHIDGYTPERVMMELSTPAKPHQIDDVLFTLSPTLTSKFTFKDIVMDTNIEETEITLRFIEIQNPHKYPIATRAEKTEVLRRMDIVVTDDQTPLQAWLLTMCRENGLPEVLAATIVGEVAADLCRDWLYWLA